MPVAATVEDRSKVTTNLSMPVVKPMYTTLLESAVLYRGILLAQKRRCSIKGCTRHVSKILLNIENPECGPLVECYCMKHYYRRLG